MEEVCSHHGLLVRWTEETYGFAHLALQEFLTAKWLADERRWEEFIVPNQLLDPWWKNVIGLTLGSMSDGTEALERILRLAELTDIDRYRIAAHCLRYDPIILPKVREGVVRQVLNWYHHGDVSHHDAAIGMLVGIEDDWSSKAITNSLQITPTSLESNVLGLRRRGGA